MARPVKKRLGVKIDMTPMVDVAFLLLIFFMSTTQFKSKESVPVILPGSHSALKLPEADVLIITISDQNKVYLTLGEGALDSSMGYLKRNAEGDFRAVEFEPSKVSEGIATARSKLPYSIAKDLRFMLKADKNAEYGYVEDVVASLQKININRFNMVTELETEQEKE